MAIVRAQESTYTGLLFGYLEGQGFARLTTRTVVEARHGGTFHTDTSLGERSSLASIASSHPGFLDGLETRLSAFFGRMGLSARKSGGRKAGRRNDSSAGHTSVARRRSFWPTTMPYGRPICRRFVSILRALLLLEMPQTGQGLRRKHRTTAWRQRGDSRPECQESKAVQWRY